MKKKTLILFSFVLIFAGTSLAAIGPWPDAFNPTQLRTLNIQMDPADWEIVRFDTTFDIEKPAYFWADNETPIYVNVRRKSCDALPNESDPFKISIKVDFNDYYCDPLDPLDPDCPGHPDAASDWHGLKKLSLENGDDQDVVSEGIAANLHRLASGPKGYNYPWACWYANWVKLYINGVYRGVYVNNEQYDKPFMINRGLYVWHETWMYKYSSEGQFTLNVGDELSPSSPATDALCYSPFAHLKTNDPIHPTGGICPTPTNTNLVNSVNQWMDVRSLLALGAVNAIICHDDSMFTHFNNTVFIDFDLNNPAETRKRMWFPWDMDSTITSTSYNLYVANRGETSIQSVIFGNPTLRAQYDDIIEELINGPLTAANINAFIDTIQPILAQALVDDTNNNIGNDSDISDRFDQLRAWFTDRIDNVAAQIGSTTPPPPPPGGSGNILLAADFDNEGNAWDAGFDFHPHNWKQSQKQAYTGVASVHAEGTSSSGDFISNPADASDALEINVDFWLRKKNLEPAEDCSLYYYNGTGYDLIADLESQWSQEEVWLHYTHTITDNRYFIPDFKIKFFASTDSNKEDIWLDQVTITKEIDQSTLSDIDGDTIADESDNCPTTPNTNQADWNTDGLGDACECAAANLDGIGKLDMQDFVVLAADWLDSGPALGGDVNHNGIVNIIDLQILVAHWFASCQ